MLAIIDYFKCFSVEHYTLSIDKIIIDYNFCTENESNTFLNLISVLDYTYDIAITHWTSYSPGSFRENFTISIENGNSFWLGVGLNGKSLLSTRVRLEWNPNKMKDNPTLVEILAKARKASDPSKRHIPRFDLAIDIPVPRNNCFICKDHRLYIQRKHGAENTEYLGSKSSKVGRVKLYNKQAESNLTYPLTRLELTLDPLVPYEDQPFPTVYYVKPGSLDLKTLRLTDTDRFILNALLHGCGSVTSLCRKTREKMQDILDVCITKVELPKDAYQKTLRHLNSYL